MNIETQNRIINNPNDLKFLRENSLWYKYLNRNKYYIKQFEEEMKSIYKLKTEDKVNKFAQSVDMISKVIDILN